MSARRLGLAGLLVALSFLFSLGCGYSPLYASRDPLGPFAVAGGPHRIPSAVAAVAAEAGARAELARAGMLASCSPRSSSECSVILIEILRLEEETAGIAADGSPFAGPPAPMARGLRVTVTGRARLVARGADAARDTGDVRSSFVLGRGDGDAASISVAREEAVRIAARRLGERLAGRILGVPDASDE